MRWWLTPPLACTNRCRYLGKKLVSLSFIDTSRACALWCRGREIDAHTVVVRLEDAPTVGYETAVGARTTLRIAKSPDEVHPATSHHTRVLTQGVCIERAPNVSRWNVRTSAHVYAGQVYRERSEAVLVTEFCSRDGLTAMGKRRPCGRSPALEKINELKVRPVAN